MQPHVAMELMKRAITIAENQWPEMADALETRAALQKMAAFLKRHLAD